MVNFAHLLPDEEFDSVITSYNFKNDITINTLKEILVNLSNGFLKVFVDMFRML